MVQDNPAFQSDNNFEFCQARCRTSSESVLYDKEYRSFHKYCYGIRPPSKEADFGIDRTKYAALYNTKQQTKKVKTQMKEVIKEDDMDMDGHLVFLDMEGAANPLELIDPHHFQDTQIFGMLRGNEDTSAASQPLPDFLLLLFPVFTLILAYCFSNIHLQSYKKLKKD